MLMSKLRSIGIMMEAPQLIEIGTGESRKLLILKWVGVDPERAHGVSSIVHFKASTAQDGAPREKKRVGRRMKLFCLYRLLELHSSID